MIAPHRTRSTAWAAVILASIPAAPVRGEPVVIETVLVGHPGNPGEQSRLPSGDQTFYGSVAYVYAMGRYEVTAGQYTAFLNAVAASDTYGLYDPRMDYDADPTRSGCNIKRVGAPGSHAYSVAPDWRSALAALSEGSQTTLGAYHRAWQ